MNVNQDIDKHGLVTSSSNTSKGKLKYNMLSVVFVSS